MKTRINNAQSKLTAADTENYLRARFGSRLIDVRPYERFPAIGHIYSFDPNDPDWVTGCKPDPMGNEWRTVESYSEVLNVFLFGKNAKFYFQNGICRADGKVSIEPSDEDGVEYELDHITTVPVPDHETLAHLIDFYLNWRNSGIEGKKTGAPVLLSLPHSEWFEEPYFYAPLISEKIYPLKEVARKLDLFALPGILDRVHAPYTQVDTKKYQWDSLEFNEKVSEIYAQGQRELEHVRNILTGIEVEGPSDLDESDILVLLGGDGLTVTRQAFISNDWDNQLGDLIYFVLRPKKTVSTVALKEFLRWTEQGREFLKKFSENPSDPSLTLTYLPDVSDQAADYFARKMRWSRIREMIDELESIPTSLMRKHQLTETLLFRLEEFTNEFKKEQTQ